MFLLHSPPNCLLVPQSPWVGQSSAAATFPRGSSSPSDFTPTNNSFTLQSPNVSPGQLPDGLLQLRHCVGCQCLIMDSQLVKFQLSPNRFLHEHCAVCSVCNASLMPYYSSFKCYEKDGRLFCRTHYFEYFVPKTFCVGCNLSVQLDQLFCKFKNGIAYHFHCLRCSQCGKTFSRGGRLLLGEKCGTIKCVEHISNEKKQKRAENGGRKTLSERDDGGGAKADDEAPRANAKQSQREGIEAEESGQNEVESWEDEAEAANWERKMDKMMVPLLHLPNLDKEEEEESICDGPISSGDQSFALSSNNSDEEDNKKQKENGEEEEKEKEKEVVILAWTKQSDEDKEEAEDEEDVLSEEDKKGRRKGGRGGGGRENSNSSRQPTRLSKGRCANTPAIGPLLQYPSEMYAVGEQFSKEEEDAHQKVNGNKRRGPRTTISQKQLDILNLMFDNTSKPSKHERAKLAQDSGLSMRVIQVWFQNRRSKERRLKHLCNFLRHYEGEGQQTPKEKRDDFLAQ